MRRSVTVQSRGIVKNDSRQRELPQSRDIVSQDLLIAGTAAEPIIEDQAPALTEFRAPRT